MIGNRKRAIHTPHAPQAIGPYSQGVEAGGLVFVSGQLPIDPATGRMVADSPRAAAAQCMTNAFAVLEKAGLYAADVVRVGIFLADMDHFAEINETYATFFTEPFPARACVQAARLPKDALVEIEMIALRS